MIPLGYMAKFVMRKTQWLKGAHITDIYSVSSCMSKDFIDWTGFWRHNGYWFFDSPSIISEIAEEGGVDLRPATWFYYEGFDKEFAEESGWRPYVPEPSFPLAVEMPERRILRGYDVVCYYCGNSSGHSPLSCNALADKIKVNAFCLLDSLEEAQSLLEGGRFKNSEPGPYRIIAVYTLNMGVEERAQGKMG